MKDIRELSHHFNEPGGDISPWMFVPGENISEMSTSECPGLLTIRQAGKGKDIKGILKEPIKVDDYKMPWQFQLGLTQNYCASLLGIGDAKQMNYAIGFNLAVTFSDPSCWPADREEMPPETRVFQLFAIHLGSTGEFSGGLPQFAKPEYYFTTDDINEYGFSYKNETFLIWGRGDLDEKLNGDWKIPYIFSQNMPYYGPASPQLYFFCDVVNDTSIEIGIKFDAKHDHIMKKIDCSKYGRITGIWEIGPIFSCDRWIPDILCKQLPVVKEIENPPEPIATNPIYEFYVDYCVFIYRSSAAPLDHNSDDFEIPGYLGKWLGFQIPFSAETWSNPGNLTITLLAPSQGCWFGSNNLCAHTIDLLGITANDQNRYSVIHKPPWEIEICFTVPDDSAPWRLTFYQRIHNEKGKLCGYWQPGVANSPLERRHKYVNYASAETTVFDVSMDRYLEQFGTNLKNIQEFRKAIESSFKFDIPEEILSHKPLYMLYQVIDCVNFRIGFKTNKEEPWFLSEPFNMGKLINGKVGLLTETCQSITKGRQWGLEEGNPMYQKFLIHHMHYRYGLSE